MKTGNRLLARDSLGLSRRVSVILCFAICTLTSSVFAQDKGEIFELRTNDNLVSAYAILVRSQSSFASMPGTSNTRPAASSKKALLKLAEPGVWQAIVKLDPADYQANILLSIVAQTASGKVVVSDVRTLSATAEMQVADTGCGDDDLFSVKKLLAQDRETLELVVKGREIRRDRLTEKLKVELDDEFLTALNMRERRLGLNYPQPLSRDMPLEELTNRIAGIASQLKARQSNQ